VVGILLHGHLGRGGRRGEGVNMEKTSSRFVWFLLVLAETLRSRESS
jgi:hypothetical protein